MNPNSLLFSQRERERESSKSSRDGDGAMVLCKLSVPGHPTNLDNSRVRRAYCACSMCGWGSFEHFCSLLSFFFSSSLFGTRPDID